MVDKVAFITGFGNIILGTAHTHTCSLVLSIFLMFHSGGTVLSQFIICWHFKTSIFYLNERENVGE